ncbi:hypothetical protein HK099_008063 [Clydaea vesicula]|uniref:Uncharacterized protein n=1 Tax=Clydaea vesicula TaxID=447962 RepID=A0AAD5Y2J4_9FUNG|nr:hypothetical protein HK099_008063 [Clydaea vesicula]
MNSIQSSFSLTDDISNNSSPNLSSLSLDATSSHELFFLKDQLKKNYQNNLSKNLPHHQELKKSATKKWSDILGPADFNTLISHAFSKPRTPMETQIYIKLLYRRLPVNHYSKGIKKCLRCGYNDETIEHAIFECKESFEYWNNVNNLIYSILSPNVLTAKPVKLMDVIYFFPEIRKILNIRQLHVLSVIHSNALFALWSSRSNTFQSDVLGINLYWKTFCMRLKANLEVHHTLAVKIDFQNGYELKKNSSISSSNSSNHSNTQNDILKENYAKAASRLGNGKEDNYSSGFNFSDSPMQLQITQVSGSSGIITPSSSPIAERNRKQSLGSSLNQIINSFGSHELAINDFDFSPVEKASDNNNINIENNCSNSNGNTETLTEGFTGSEEELFFERWGKIVTQEKDENISQFNKPFLNDEKTRLNALPNSKKDGTPIDKACKIKKRKGSKQNLNLTWKEIILIKIGHMSEPKSSPVYTTKARNNPEPVNNSKYLPIFEKPKYPTFQLSTANVVGSL